MSLLYVSVNISSRNLKAVRAGPDGVSHFTGEDHVTARVSPLFPSGRVVATCAHTHGHTRTATYEGESEASTCFFSAGVILVVD